VLREAMSAWNRRGLEGLIWLGMGLGGAKRGLSSLTHSKSLTLLVVVAILTDVLLQLLQCTGLGFHRCYPGLYIYI
jgi:hypothetical protein